MRTAKPDDGAGESPSALITAKIEALGDWRKKVFARTQEMIRQADPEVVEAVKWRKQFFALVEECHIAKIGVMSHAAIWTLSAIR